MKINLTINESELTQLKELCRGNDEALLYIFKLQTKKKKKSTKKQQQRINKINATRKNLENRAKEFRKDLIKKQTDAEKKFKIYLKQAGISYEFQKIIYYEKSFYIVDFYVPRGKLVFEIDGGYHTEKEQVIKDRRRTRVLKSTGIKKVYRFTNKETDDSTLCIQRIKHILNI